jgi:hypothetical protein
VQKQLVGSTSKGSPPILSSTELWLHIRPVFRNVVDPVDLRCGFFVRDVNPDSPCARCDTDVAGVRSTSPSPTEPCQHSMLAWNGRGGPGAPLISTRDSAIGPPRTFPQSQPRSTLPATLPISLHHLPDPSPQKLLVRAQCEQRMSEKFSLPYGSRYAVAELDSVETRSQVPYRNRCVRS